MRNLFLFCFLVFLHFSENLLAEGRDTSKFLSISVGPTYEYRGTKLREANNSVSNFNNACYLAQMPKMGYFIKVGVEKCLFHSNFFLAFGAQFENKGYKVKEISDSVYLVNSSNPVGGRTLKYSQTFNYYYFSVPLGIKYVIIEGRLRLNFLAGIVFDGNGKYGENIKFSTGEILSYNSSPHSWNIGECFQIGVSWKLNNAVRLSFDPGYIRSLFYNDNLRGGADLPYQLRFYSYIFPITIYLNFDEPKRKNVNLLSY
jgi:hypothetical protein